MMYVYTCSVRCVSHCTMISHGDLALSSPVNHAIVTTMQIAVTMTVLLILTVTAISWEEEECVTTANTTQVSSPSHLKHLIYNQP